MTGIERLRELASGINPRSVWSVTSDEYDNAHGLDVEHKGGQLRDFLADIADQIELELTCDKDTIDNIRLIVGSVVNEMERHILGHEGMEDSPVARWARELRGALKSDTSDGPEAQNPSCVDSAETADVTSEAQKVTRDPAEDVSMSAYDLLPADEREAIAWVREHGGIDHVRAEWRSRVPPVLAADGEPPEVGQTVWDTNGDELVIGALEDGGHTVTCRYADVGDGIPTHGMWSPSDLTHQRPDTWQRIEEDAEKLSYNTAQDAYHGLDMSKELCDGIRDLVRRCRALAERERSE